MYCEQIFDAPCTVNFASVFTCPSLSRRLAPVFPGVTEFVSRNNQPDLLALHLNVILAPAVQLLSVLEELDLCLRLTQVDGAL